MNLKDLKLNDMIKVALAVTAMLIITLNVAISSNNSTVINNYVQETTKKLDATKQTLDAIQKTGNYTQSNITKLKVDTSKTLAISKEILNEVN